jgi:hypothetical protein
MLIHTITQIVLRERLDRLDTGAARNRSGGVMARESRREDARGRARWSPSRSQGPSSRAPEIISAPLALWIIGPDAAR